MTFNEFIKTLVIDVDKEYSEEINEYINIHNSAVSSFIQGLTMSSILSILYKKNIITEKEFDDEINGFLSSSKQKDILENNRDAILQCIEAEKSLNNELQVMRDSLESEYLENMKESPDNVSGDFEEYGVDC